VDTATDPPLLSAPRSNADPGAGPGLTAGNLLLVIVVLLGILYTWRWTRRAQQHR
jgi:hypothetical protein